MWDYATEYDLPRAFVLNWMDRELASYERALDSVQQVFGRGVVPIQLPIGWEKGFRGVVDLITMKALIYTPDGNGIAKIEEIPQDLADEAKLGHEALVEMVAEGDDALMQEFFDQGTLPVHDLVIGLREAVLAKRLFPVMLSSALHNIGQRCGSEFDGCDFPVAGGARKNRCATKPRTTKARRWSARSAIRGRFRFSCSRRWRIRSRAASRISR